MANLIKTKNRVISIVCRESPKEINDAIKEHTKIVSKITNCTAEKLMVLSFVLRELPKLSKKHKWIRFDFGTKKEWELRRIK